MQLEIRLLGQFDVSYLGSSIQVHSRPAQSLLAYLVLNAGIAFRREKVAGLFWPDSSEKNARGYLRSALWHLRRAFESTSAPWQAYFKIDSISIAFDKKSDYRLDADLICDSKEAKDWSVEELGAIAALFQGELLPGFYDDWIIPERERLQVCFDQKMRLLLNRLVAQRRWNDVLKWGEHWIVHGQEPEPAFRAMLIANAALGDLARVNFLYQRYEEVLKEEHGVEASTELNELRSKLTGGKIPVDLLPSLMTSGLEGSLLHHQISSAALEWSAANKDESSLLRGTRLSQATEWVQTHYADLDNLEQEFLDTSRQVENRTQLELEAQRLREQETAEKLAVAEQQRRDDQVKAARILRRRILPPIAIGILAVVLASGAIYAWQRSAAQAAINHNLNLARAAQQVNQTGQGDLALALALEAVNGKTPPSEALGALRRVASSPGTRAILEGHSLAVKAAAFSPDMRTVISAGCAQLDTQDNCLAGELILWDLSTKTELRRWSAHTAWINAVAFSPDGQLLISGSSDGSIILWDTSTTAEIRTLPGKSGGVTSLTFANGSDALLTGTANGSLILWNLKTGAIIREYMGFPSPITSLAAAAEKPIAVTGYADGTVILWDLESSRPVRISLGTGVAVNSIAMNNDGDWYLYTSGNELRQIHSESGGVIRQQEFGDSPGRLALSSDGASVLMSRVGAVIQWDVVNWREQNKFIGLSGNINSLSVSGDGSLGLSANSDGSLRLWNLVEALEYKIYDSGIVNADAMAVSPDGKYLLLGDLSANAPKPYLWDISQARVVRTFSGYKGQIPADSVKISSDGRYASAAGGFDENGKPVLIIWEFKSGEVACRLEGYQSSMRSIAFSPNSRYLLGGSQGLDGELILWDIQKCQLIRRFALPPGEDVIGIAYSTDGKQAVTGTSFLNRAVLWDVATGNEIMRFEGTGFPEAAPILDVDFGPDGKTVIGAGVGGLYVWDMQTQKIIHRFNLQTGLITDLDLSPDGKYILSGSTNGEVILWSFATGEEIYRLNAHQKQVYSLAFSPNGSIAYSISSDGMLAEWQITVQSLPEMISWIQSNRYVRDLTCNERQQYHVEPLCK